MVKTLALQENRATYTLSVEEKVLGQDTIILERDGQPIAAIVPIEVYQALQEQREEQAALAAFQQEREAFERLKPELLRTHPGKCVAILKGEVIEVGDDKMAVLGHVYERLGYVPVYVQRVEEAPQPRKFPHRKVVR